jgi:copper chaperone NosL
MKNLPRILYIIGGLSLLLLFVLPLWRISLIAPQYPDGVHMWIYINKIGGSEPGTLQNINILNHYIGMKYIEPDSIPELTYFPYAVIGFIVTALIAALMDNKWLYLTWITIMVLGCILAVYDFYLWEYDYGHNLDPNAIMKFEGESFQPPLIGNKVLLNFLAKSYPHYGGYALMLSLVLTTLGTYFKFKPSKK